MKTKYELKQWRDAALANISGHRHTYWAFFNGDASKHQAQLNQNEAQIISFTFWFIKVQLHFIGSVKRKEKLGRFSIFFGLIAQLTWNHLLTCTVQNLLGLKCWNPWAHRLSDFYYRPARESPRGINPCEKNAADMFCTEAPSVKTRPTRTSSVCSMSRRL